MLKSVEARSGTMALAKAYGDRLMQGLTSGATMPLEGQGTESIDTGTSGAILYLIELYRQSNDIAYAAIIDRMIGILCDYCRETATNNYSLYTGRAGVIYVLIQWYLIKKDNELIHQALSLVTPANREYLHSGYTTDYLYNGRSGTLLTLIHLYLLTEQSSLLPYIKEFSSMICGNAKFFPGGIFWTAEEEINCHPSCGFAYGLSGVLYVLRQLSGLLYDATLDLIISEGRRFQNGCLKGDRPKWGNSHREISSREMLLQYQEAYLRGDCDLYEPREEWGWANGATGMLVSSLFDKDSEGREYLGGKLSSIIAGNAFGSDSLYNGLAGAGLYLLGAGAKECSQLPEIVHSISDSTSLSSTHLMPKGGLLHGDLGKMYFLLKATGRKEPSENILIPFPDTEFRHRRIDLSLSAAELRTTWLKRYYPRTVHLLENKVKGAIDKHLAKPLLPYREEMEAFGSLVNSRLAADTPAALHKCLTDVHGLERSKIEFCFSDTRSSFQIMLEERHLRSKVLALLNAPGDWLMHQTLMLSSQIKVLSTGWNWSFYEESNQIRERQNETVDHPSGTFEYIVQMSGSREVVEFSLKKDVSMLLHLFDRPTRVDQALVEIDRYVRSMPKEKLLELLLSVSDSQDVADYLDKLGDTVLFTIRQWIYRGILVINQEK